MIKIIIADGAVFYWLCCCSPYYKQYLDKLTYTGNLESVASVPEIERYAFEQVYICDSAGLDRVFSQYQPDAVLHLTTESHVDRSISGSTEFIEINIVGTYTLLEAAPSYWNSLDERHKKHFASIMSLQMRFTVILFIQMRFSLVRYYERTPYAPSSPYSASKISSDYLVR